jgi:thiol-disulfide isomerase/thioredoxin
MKKSLILILTCQLFLLTVGSQLNAQEAIQQSIAKPGELNTQVTIEDETMLKGLTNRAAFDLPKYKHWFDSTYQAYDLNTKMLAEIQSVSPNIRFEIYLGTWCSDSRREVPALYKVMDQLSISKDQIYQVCVDRSKVVPESLMTLKGLEFVPTIVVYENNQEVGRIVEFPNETIEKDLVMMLLK